MIVLILEMHVQIVLIKKQVLGKHKGNTGLVWVTEGDKGIAIVEGVEVLEGFFGVVAFLDACKAVEGLFWDVCLDVFFCLGRGHEAVCKVFVSQPILINQLMYRHPYKLGHRILWIHYLGQIFLQLRHPINHGLLPMIDLVKRHISLILDPFRLLKELVPVSRLKQLCRSWLPVFVEVESFSLQVEIIVRFGEV